MFTSIDKALVSAVMGGLSLLNLAGVIDVKPETGLQISAAIAVLSPFLVYLIPNKKQDK